MIRIFLVFVLICLIFACEKTSKPLENVILPTFNPVQGTYLAPLTGNGAVKLNCATTGASIRYTLDGTDPTENSTLYSTTNPIEITQQTTIKAKAFKEGMNPSPIASSTYLFSVASVSIYPISGNYSIPQTIQIYPVTPSTVIRYTLDGSEPTETSTLYTGAFILNTSATLKARGFIDGWIASSTTTAVYNFNISNLVINPAGGTYTQPQNIIITTATPNTMIYYTIDDSEPTQDSDIYTGPFILDGNCTLKAKGFNQGWNPSALASAAFTFNCTQPIFSITAGTFSIPFNLTMTTSTQGASIRYTTDNTEPNGTSNLYTEPLNISSSTIIKARTVKLNWNSSPVITSSYILKVVNPTFNPLAGVYDNPVNVTIASTTPNVQLYYTLDGSNPTESSSLYSSPVEIAASGTLKARAYKSGWSSSDIVQGQYTINLTQTVATPQFNPPGGTYSAPQSVVISCPTLNAIIHYTTDGSEPTNTSPIYTNPISVSQNTSIKAKAYRSGWFDSQVASADYIINFTLGQMIHVPGGTFTMGRTTGSGDADELPTHTVTLTSFTIGKYEVTQLEWLTVMGSNPSYYTGDLYRPVETVSWYAALVYCNKRSILEGLTPVYTINGSTNPDNWGSIPITLNADWNAAQCNWSASGYRLPTEAEWEYAARGTTNNPDFLYAGSNTAIDVAWFLINSGSITHIVGHLMPNGIGTNDMSGNVNEWCWDWYDSAYYNVSPPINPTGPDTGSWRINRGGDFDDHSASLCRVARRIGNTPWFATYNQGLRVVRSQSRK